jgi:predicted Zn-dependent peptidase
MPIEGNVSYCGFFINAGTRDESDSQHGMAHFVEHMLFKGTKKRRASHIINRMENVGGELNAYTNKEETVVYSVFLEEHFSRAVELLSDLVFSSQFPQHELEKERDVIIDEIHSYEDSPSELIYDEFENLLFIGSQLGHNILGTPQSLELFDSERVHQYVDKYYQPSNMVFFSMGSTPMKKIISQVEKYVSDINSAEIVNGRIAPVIIPSLKQNIKRDTAQAHAIIGGRTYAMKSPKRKALLLLNNILGGPGMNSRLNISLREKRGYVYNVESNLTTYTDSGLFTIYFGSDKQHVDKCIDLVYKELKKLRDVKLTAVQLVSAKKQLMGQIGISADNHENVSLSLGKSFFHYGHYDSPAEIFSKIEQVTADQVLEVANEIYDEKLLFSLIYD